MKITYLIEVLRLAKRHDVDVELDTAKGRVHLKPRAKTAGVVWQPYSTIQLHVEEA